MRELIYVNYGGFNIVYIDELRKKCNINNYKSLSVVNWKYLLLLKRIVTFPIVFKYIFDKQGKGLQYARIRFREQIDKPVELLLHLMPTRTIFLINSNPSPSRILRRIFANPRYSETLLFLAEVHDDIEKELVQYNDLLKLSKKLFMELSNLVYKRGVGRFNALKIREREGVVDITICVSKKGVSLETSYGDIKVSIKDIEFCLPK